MFEAAAKQAALQAEQEAAAQKEADELRAKVLAREKDLAELSIAKIVQKDNADRELKLAQMNRAAAVAKIQAELETLQKQMDQKSLEVEQLNRSTQSLRGLGTMAKSIVAVRIRSILPGNKQLTMGDTSNTASA